MSMILPPGLLQRLQANAGAPAGTATATGAHMPATRQFTPGPMPEVPFMPPAQVGPQTINLGFTPSPAGPAAPPFTGGPQGDPRMLGQDQPPAFGPGGRWGQHAPTQFGAPPPAGPSMDPRGFGQGYQNPMQLMQQKLMNRRPPMPMNPALMNLGLGMMQSKQMPSIGQSLPVLMSMLNQRGAAR